MLIEVCVNSAISAIEAQKGGAGRVELCENMLEGGCTPSAGSIQFALNNLKIPVFVMIRPRGGDFCYSEEEFRIMKKDIRTAKELGADGVVFGILNPDGTIDKVRMEQLVAVARPMGITCHRAFDMTVDPFAAMEDLIELGIDRVLTSGQQKIAAEGAAIIGDLIKKALGRIIIMPGSGVKEHNITDLISKTGASEVHVHLDKQVPGGMKFQQPSVYMGKPDLSEFTITITDAERVRKIQSLLKNIKP
jgi:copper homeostasis protein